MKKLSNEQGFHLIAIPLLVVVFAIIGFAGWYVYSANKDTNKTLDNVGGANNTLASPTPTPSVATTPSPAQSGWLTYDDTKHKLSFDYPVGSTVAVSDDVNLDRITIDSADSKYQIEIRFFMGDKGGWAPERKIGYNFSVSGNKIVLSDDYSDDVLTEEEIANRNAPGGYSFTVVEGYYIQARPAQYTAADAANKVVADIILHGTPVEETDAAIAIFEQLVGSIRLN